MQPASIRINLSRPGLPMANTLFALPVVIRHTLEVIEKNKLKSMNVPEFGFCNVCQPLSASQASKNSGFIDEHSQHMKMLLWGACLDCTDKVWTDDRFCYVLDPNKHPVVIWMPMHMRS